MTIIARKTVKVKITLSGSGNGMNYYIPIAGNTEQERH